VRAFPARRRFVDRVEFVFKANSVRIGRKFYVTSKRCWPQDRCEGKGKGEDIRSDLPRRHGGAESGLSEVGTRSGRARASETEGCHRGIPRSIREGTGGKKGYVGSERIGKAMVDVPSFTFNLNPYTSGLFRAKKTVDLILPRRHGGAESGLSEVIFGSGDLATEEYRGRAEGGGKDRVW